MDLIDYANVFEGKDTVLIKVNFICKKTWDTGATTDPIVVEAIIKKLSLLPVKIYVVESDATMTNADKAYFATGMKKMCDHNGVEFLNLRHVKERVDLEIPGGETLNRVKVPRIVIESAIVSAAKLKTHLNTTVTLGMKNMFGLLPDKFKGKFHSRGISKVILDINTVLKPALTVVDGFVGMEGKGPVDGTPVNMDLVIAGTDVVATDSIASQIMGFNPDSIKHISRAHEKGLGNMKDIEVVGEKIKNVIRSFKPA